MAALILPSRRVVQPQGPVEINWGNPLTRGLVWAINPGAGRFYDAVSYTNFSATTITKRTGRVGVEDSYSGRFEVATLRPIPSNSDFSILVLATATNTRQALFCQRVANDSSDIELRLASDNNGAEALNSVAFRANSDTAAPTWAAASVDLTSGPHVYAGTLRGSTQSVFVDGRVGGTRTNTNPVSTSATPVFGGLNGSTVIPFTGTAGLYAAWRRALSEVEIAEVSANPWQLFRPIQRRIWVSVAGGGNNQSIAFTLDDVNASVSQSVTHSQSLAASLDGVSASISQAVQHSQSMAVTLDSVSVNVAQSVEGQKSQALAITLDGVAVNASQTVNHSQSMAATLDGVTVEINQSAASPLKTQTLAATLDDVSVSVNQIGALPALGGFGFVMVDMPSRQWWKRKPKAIPEQVAKQRIKRVVRAIQEVTQEQAAEPAKATQSAAQQQREVYEAIAPMLAEMPGFDWKQVFRQIVEQDTARRQMQAAIARARFIEQDDEDVLLLML